MLLRYLPTDDPYGYWHALERAWRSGETIVNVEHDMEFSDELVGQLLDCPHPLCTHAYRVWIVGQQRWVFSPTRDGAWIEAGVTWAHTASLGFCKIEADVRERPLARLTWKFLEHAVCDAVEDCGWHVHWPEIRHFHDYDSEAEGRMSEWERFAADAGEACHVVPSREG